jgi:hypothetical protein
MIATTRGLAVLAAIAVALLVLSFARSRPSGPIDRSVLPGFDAAKAGQLEFTRNGHTVTIVRDGDQWRWSSPPGVADPATIDAVVTALRGGHWHRRARIEQAGPRRAAVTVDGTTLSIHNELPGTGQTWIVRGDDALLVDSWIASALMPEPLMLRTRHPLACASTVTAALPNSKVRIAAGRLIEPRELWLDERWLQLLADACSRVELVAFDGKRDSRVGVHVAARGAVREVGSCGRDRVLVDTDSGEGCIEAAALRAVADVLRDPQPDPRPLPIDPAKLTLQDGSILDVTAKRLAALDAGKRVADVDADPERVRELISALMTRGTVKPRPSARPTATITAVDRAGTEVVLEVFDRAIARHGEPVAIEIAADAWKIITRPSAALKDPVRWREDAANLTALTLDNITYKRGAVLGEWTREPAGKLDPTLVDALVESLATLRAPTAPPPAAVAHRLRITITPPAGAPITHAIELAAPTHDGCAARVDNAPVLLPLPLCTAAIALASSR